MDTEYMTPIRAIKRSLSAIMTRFSSTQCMPTGVEQMTSPTNTLPTAITSSSEKKTSPSSYHLRHIYDDLTYPQLNLKVCLSGPDEDRVGFNLWLGRCGCRFVDDPLAADFVIFTGGSDVVPSSYGEAAIAETWAHAGRDAEDNLLWDLCRKEGIPMVGICRGAQFLWTKMGGKLYQHVDNHNGGEHEIFCFADRKKYRASSVHHQMCRPESLPGFKLLANATISENRKSANFTTNGPSSDFEIYTFAEEGILGIQGHPEYEGFPNYSELCARLIDTYIYDNPATIYRAGKLRLAKAMIENKEKK